MKRYAKVPLRLTGKEVAEKMLRDNGITDVKVTCVQGHLTDHYNPADKTVNLSEITLKPGGFRWLLCDFEKL